MKIHRKVLRMISGGWLGGRKYPIKWDEDGRSARQRAFALFDTGHKRAGASVVMGGIITFWRGEKNEN